MKTWYCLSSNGWYTIDDVESLDWRHCDEGTEVCIAHADERPMHFPDFKSCDAIVSGGRLMYRKDGNPKSRAAIGKKPCISDIPTSALMALANVHSLGALKYGRYNWRESGVSDTVYIDAIGRHLLEWWNGNLTDEESGESHLAHVMACCAILIDAEKHGKLNATR